MFLILFEQEQMMLSQ